MSKTITSPVPQFPGTVVISTTPNMALVENYLDARSTGEGISTHERNAALFLATVAWVEEWHIEGQPEHPTPETFVAVPYIPARQLISWLIGEVLLLVIGETTIPNESGPGPTPTQATPATTENQPN